MDQYREGMLVAQWHQDGRIEFVQPSRYVVEPCGELIYFHNKSLSMQLSDEHRMPLYQWDGAFVVKEAAAVAKKPSRHIVPTTFTPPYADAPVSDDEIRLAVAINADGHHVKRGFQTQITVRKPRKKARIAELLEAVGVEFKTRTYASRPTETTFDFIHSYKGKRFSGWYWWTLSKRQLAVVIDEMSHWDGLFTTDEVRFHGAYKEDADFIQYAAHAIGGKATIHRVRYAAANWSDLYVVHVAMPGSVKSVVTLRGDGVTIERIPTTDGKKYCFTVPTGFFVARHNNAIFVTGNSGKSSGCAIEILRRCQMQRVGPDGFRRSRWAIVRNTAPQLRDTTMKTFFDWIPPGVAGRWKETEKTFYLELGDVRAEIMFRPLDSPEDVQRVLSLELTGAWLNECREIPMEILQALQGRLWRYPSKANGGSSWCGIIADTNPPEEGSYWYKVIEHLPIEETNPDSVVICESFKQPSGLSPDADNIANLDNPNYYQDLARGKTEEWVNTYIHGMYSPSQSGKPVYLKSFKGDRHVSQVPLIPAYGLPIVVGVDFGLTPAAVFMQMQHDGRVKVLRELTEFDMGIKRFAEQRLRPMVKNLFSDMSIVLIGDPAGVQRVGTDEQTCFKVLKDSGFYAKPAHTNDPASRIGSFLEALSSYPDGEPLIQIDPSCKMLIEALRSKYRYVKFKGAVDKFTDKPEKNNWSHVMEAAQYALMFLLNKYDASDYIHVSQRHNSDAFTTRRTYRPADSHTGY
jgi:hypothetical protein